jgi:NAD(P)-dependent dehydrogenase (short-subunit alcohol dehydrogenase family)
MRNVLVVGATGGIGSALAKRLAADSHVWSASRSAGDAQRDRSFAWDAVGADFPADRLPERLDGLVYCPGTITLLPFERLSEDSFRQDLELNLLGAVRVIKAALPALKAAPRAGIVLFSTVAVSTGMPMHASIASAKGAVEGLTRSLAAEFAPTIRVNAIAPSLTDTPLASRVLRTERQREAAAARHPLQRIGRPEDLAALAAFLLSDEADWISGQVIHADGGMGSLRRFS